MTCHKHCDKAESCSGHITTARAAAGHQPRGIQKGVRLGSSMTVLCSCYFDCGIAFSAAAEEHLLDEQVPKHCL
eukprot:939608-Amphidinium_carterae.3